jgi:hypothetical protein
MAKEMICPSCGFKMIGGKYCPECRAELVAEETMKPVQAGFSEELVEKTAQRTLQLLREEMNASTTETQAGPSGGQQEENKSIAGPSAEQSESGQPGGKSTRKGFFSKK